MSRSHVVSTFSAHIFNIFYFFILKHAWKLKSKQPVNVLSFYWRENSFAPTCLSRSSTTRVKFDCDVWRHSSEKMLGKDFSPLVKWWFLHTGVTVKHGEFKPQSLKYLFWNAPLRQCKSLKRHFNSPKKNKKTWKTVFSSLHEGKTHTFLTAVWVKIRASRVFFYKKVVFCDVIVCLLKWPEPLAAH